MKKRPKPDAAERIAGTVENIITYWYANRENAREATKQLAARIRRAIRAAVKAERIRMYEQGWYIYKHGSTMTDKAAHEMLTAGKGKR